MGYTTWFNGSLTFNKPVTEELKTYINQFSNVRHMKRDVDKIKELYPNWIDNCYKGNLGYEGEYFVGGCGTFGCSYNEDVTDYNCPPLGVPGLWCQWIINDDDELEWDGNEKFYDYVEWIDYLINKIFEPEGYILNGTIEFEGEDRDDRGYIKVTNNIVERIYDDGNTTINDYTDDELIAELKNRGYVVKKGA